ncbi:MAG: metallophosphoesterase [Candidatus Electrothrix sp. AR3]|nr:metallophosphoesterase [Candidatus Electrothrix sp. AR3]
MYRILLISDIHGNWPALRALAQKIQLADYDYILNCGDSTVYAPFANQVVDWLIQFNALSILGNTDSKVVRLLKGKDFKKPRQAEKRIMYTHTVKDLSRCNRQFLLGLKKKTRLKVAGHQIICCHGTPEKHTEFLFPFTPTERFRQLARSTTANIILSGHSHTPYHKIVAGTHFINPGSVGRMFDRNPAASFALLELSKKNLKVNFQRCPYDIEEVVERLKMEGLPNIYAAMYRQGQKLN